MSKRKPKQRSIPSGMTPDYLEKLLRSYRQFYEAYTSHEVEEIRLPNGIVVNIHDLLMGIRELPTRQKQALTLTCLLGYTEEEASALMGLRGARGQQANKYKKLALKNLVDGYWKDAGAGV